MMCTTGDRIDAELAELRSKVGGLGDVKLDLIFSPLLPS